jgi:hypothetical protein
MEKYIYIQRNEQFKDKPEETTNPPTITYKVISNIMGFELTGYEISDSTAKRATAGGSKPSTPVAGDSTDSSPAAPAPAGGAAGATPASPG